MKSDFTSCATTVPVFILHSQTCLNERGEKLFNTESNHKQKTLKLSGNSPLKMQDKRWELPSFC